MSESDGLSSSSSYPLTSNGITSSSSSVQLGGKKLYRKRIRKNRKGGEMTSDIEMGLQEPDIELPKAPEIMEDDSVRDLEMGPMSQEEEETFKDLELGNVPGYNPDAEEMVGGKTRKRGRKTGRKTRKVAKRKSRKVAKRKSRKGKKHISRRK
jgi:hypothetical protein